MPFGIRPVTALGVPSGLKASLIVRLARSFRRQRPDVVHTHDQRALFYDIQCPEFSDEGSTVANDRVHRAATSVVQHLTAERGAFPGIIVRLNLRLDGKNWLHSVEFLK